MTKPRTKQKEVVTQTRLLLQSIGTPDLIRYYNFLSSMKAVGEFLTIRHDQFISGKSVSRFLRSHSIYIDTQWGGYRKDPDYADFIEKRVNLLLYQEEKRDAKAENQDTSDHKFKV